MWETEEKTSIRLRLEQARDYLAQPNAPQLTEADTKEEIINPIVRCLGWSGFGTVQREYHVRSANQFIDYLMSYGTDKLMAVEAKPLQTALSDKFAAQLVQYCSVEGIEWAALTNGRELEFFNTFLNGDLAEKRVFRLNLLDFHDDEGFDAVFRQLWLLSRESLTTPGGARAWLNQQRLDRALRSLVLDPDSQVIGSIQNRLADRGVTATAGDVVQWFRGHLDPPLSPSVVPHAGSPGLPRPSERGSYNGSVSTTTAAGPASEPDRGDGSSAASRQGRSGAKASGSETMRDLVDAGLLPVGTALILQGGSREAARATINDQGEIVWHGHVYAKPSNPDFARLLGWPSLNGWMHWYADLPQGKRSLFDLRAELRQRRVR